MYRLPRFLLYFSFIIGGFFAQAQNIAYTNALWFDGKTFVPANWYAVNGALTTKAPAQIQQTVDLTGQYVVPAFGDIHCRSLSDTPSPTIMLNNYESDGFAYLFVVENSKIGRNRVAQKHNKTHPEVRFTNGSLTNSLGEPTLWEECRAQNIRWSTIESKGMKELLRGNRKAQGDTYWSVDKSADLNLAWPKILADTPAAIVIYLYDVQNNGGKEGAGLSLEMAKEVMAKAKKHKIRVFAKVRTPLDVDLGVKLGVAGFLNIPGHNWNGNGDKSRFSLSKKTIKKMAKNQIFIAPNLRKGRDAALATLLTQEPGSLENVQEYQKKTIRELLDSGVPVVLGSDDASNTAHFELSYWLQLNVFTPTELLTSLSIHTPRAIFPELPVGSLKEGSLANFLVLPDNPLLDAQKVKKKTYVVRAGIPKIED